MISQRGRMPAYRAASGLAPAVRISKPVVLRNRSHQAIGTARAANRRPRCPLRPMMIGSSAATNASVRAKVTSGPVPRSGPLIT
jgi:hypothetical protein